MEPSEKRTKCTICRHADRAAINMAIGRGVSARAIDAQYGCGRMAVQRHTSTCLPAKVAKANAELVERDEGFAFIAEMAALHKHGLDLLTEATKTGSLADRAKVLRECRENVAMLARLSGAMPNTSGPTTIDARTQILSIAGMKDLTTDELRRLAALVPGK